MNPLTQSKNATVLPLLIALMLACFGLSPQARGVCQQGCLTNQNTVLGEDALFSLTNGVSNTAIGGLALNSNTTGNFNTATGSAALISNTTGNGNTATGYFALLSNTTAIGNTATGYEALVFNTTGSNNTANGLSALRGNTTGFNNTADGASALSTNTTGSGNTATGFQALIINTTGAFNTANGLWALRSNTTGNDNIALGNFAGSNLTTGSGNIHIGNRGVAGEARTIRIGRVGTQTNTFIAGISGATVPTGVAVIVDANGHLGTTTSSARFKEAIKPMDKASEAILALKPVTFRYKKEHDPDGIPQFGLVAEQVEKVNPALVARDADGKAYTVRYEAVNAMLLNEFLKEHRRNEAQQKQIEALTEVVKAQAAQIQKVSAQLEVNKTASQIVLNNR
jgi:hypothetical protein